MATRVYMIRTTENNESAEFNEQDGCYPYVIHPLLMYTSTEAKIQMDDTLGAFCLVG